MCGPSPVEVRACWSLAEVPGLLAAVVSLAVEQSPGVRASAAAAHRLRFHRKSCGGMLELPRQGIEPVSPALAGRFFTTELPGKSCWEFLNHSFNFSAVSPKLLC